MVFNTCHRWISGIYIIILAWFVAISATAQHDDDCLTQLALLDLQQISQPEARSLYVCFKNQDRANAAHQNQLRKQALGYTTDDYNTLPFDKEFLAFQKQANLSQAQLASLQKVFSLRSAEGHAAQLTRPDLNNLEFVSNSLTGVPALLKWQDFLRNELASLERILQAKRELINELVVQTPRVARFSDLTLQQQIKLIVRVGQVFDNPFEPKFEPNALLKNLPVQDREPILAELLRIGSEARHRIKNQGNWFAKFWSFYSPFEKHAFELAKQHHAFALVKEAKINGLKRLRETRAKGNQSTVIVGAGPAGLLRAVNLSLHNRPYTLIEKRDLNGPRRKNVVTVGQGGTLQMDILMFLGFIHDRFESISFSHLKNHLVETKIGEFETYLKELLAEISLPESQIFSRTELVDVQRGPDGLILKLKGDGAPDSIVPDLLYVADGASSPTASLLGLNQLELSTPTMFIISFFNRSTVHKPGYKRIFTDLVDLAWQLVVLLGDSIHRGQSPLRTYGEYGQGVLFRIPDYDYIFYDANTEEQNRIEAASAQAFLLRRKIDLLKRNGEVDKAAALEYKIDQVQAELTNFLNARGEHMHLVTDFGTTVFRGKGHKIEYAAHEQSIFVESIIGKVESSYLKIGKTTVLVVGDAFHRTDATSGFGAKTAMESTIAEEPFLNDFSEIAPLALARAQRDRMGFANRMIDAGFRERLLYRPGTETCLFHSERAK